MSSSLKEKLHEPWKFKLLGKNSGKWVTYQYMIYKINAKWKSDGPFIVIHIDSDFFKFDSKLDYDKVLNGSLWFIYKNFLAQRKWEPFLKASAANLSYHCCFDWIFGLIDGILQLLDPLIIGWSSGSNIEG